jgi:hypothetical protein
VLGHMRFFTPKSKFKDQMIWYKDVPVGRNTLSKVAQKLAEDVPSLLASGLPTKPVGILVLAVLRRPWSLLTGLCS